MKKYGFSAIFWMNFKLKRKKIDDFIYQTLKFYKIFYIYMIEIVNSDKKKIKKIKRIHLSKMIFILLLLITLVHCATIQVAWPKPLVASRTTGGYAGWHLVKMPVTQTNTLGLPVFFFADDDYPCKTSNNNFAWFLNKILNFFFSFYFGFYFNEFFLFFLE